jgi:hypothetical protein
MKSILIIFFQIVISATIFSQITITRADYTVSGVVADNTVYRDISIVGLAIPQRGANKIWDYTTIKDTTTIRTTVNTPAVAATFSDATFVSIPRPSFGIYLFADTLYRRLDATGLYILGHRRGDRAAANIATQTGGTNDSIIALPITSRYANPPFLLKFPMTSTTFSKVLVLDTLPYQLKWAAAGYAPADVLDVRRYEYTTEVIGWGTLRLRNPVIGREPLEFGVLFERNTELRMDSFFLNGATMPKRVLDSFKLVQGKRDTASVLYNLRGIGAKRGILSFTMSNDETVITTANRVIEPNLNLQTGTRELLNNDVPLSIFPNPTTEGVNFEFDKKTDGDWQIVIYNEVGKLIDYQTIKSPQGRINHNMQLDKSLPSGTYFTQIVDELSLIRSSGRFVKL